MVLDDLKDQPIIVRSSSLLEDRVGSSFSGKYKSLFLANQGGKQERLEALTDAVAEVYASTYGPDPIGYRSERGLLDFAEEMGIMIQEVVGTRVGKYFMPVFRGRGLQPERVPLVAPDPARGRPPAARAGPRDAGRRPHGRRLSRPDRARQRLAPGQRHARRSRPLCAPEGRRHQPRIQYLRNRRGREDCCGSAAAGFPAIDKIVSVYDGQSLRKPLGQIVDFAKDDLVVTFDGLVNNSSFIPQLREVMRVLEQTLQMPVDIEFATDGNHFYLLQCRPQSFSVGASPAHIPADIPGRRSSFGPIATSRTASFPTSRTSFMSTLSSTRPCRVRPPLTRSAGPSAGSTSSCPGGALS